MSSCCSSCNTCCPEPADITVNTLNLGDDVSITAEVFDGETGLNLDLAKLVSSVFPVRVFRNGVLQRLTTDYSLATVGAITRVTFTDALLASDSIVVEYAYAA